MRNLALTSILAICSCGGSDSDPASRPTTPGSATTCATRSGSYLVKFVEKSGTCGTMPDQVMNVSSQPSQPAAGIVCTGQEADLSACRVTLESSCAGSDGYTAEMRGPIDWSADASTAHGTVQYTVLLTSSGAVQCTSVYEVNVSRL